MATFIGESPSAERGSHAAWALAVRVVRVAGRLLFAGLLLLPVRGFIAADTGLAGSLAVVGLFFVSLVRPEDGLLVCAGLLIVAGPLGAVLGSQARMGEALLLAFLAGWVLRETVRPQKPIDGPARALVTPALLLAAVVASSILVQLIVERVSVDYPWPFVRQVIVYLGSDYLLGPRRFPGIADGALMLEGIGLFMATVVLTRRQPSLARQVAGMAAVGAAGVAALNLNRLAEICLRGAGVLQTLIVHPRTIRVSSVFPDVNAAGSYLGMMLLVVVGLAVAARRARWAWVGSALLVLAAFWFTGSRIGLVAVLVSGVFVFGWVSRQRTRARLKALLVAIGVAVVALVLVDWMAAGYASRSDVTMAFRDRTEFSLAALRAFTVHPVFGVGVGRFWSVSSSYIISPEVREFAARENAHNNFLQILAELGSVGFVFFVWLLAAVGRRVRTGLTARDGGIVAGVAGGLVAFLLTCLAGHPLLIREVALAFWLILGVAAAPWLDAPSVVVVHADAPRRWRRVTVAGAVVCLALSVPVRAHWFLQNEADLEQAAIGFSKWHFDDLGVRFRTMTGRAEFYVPGSTCEIKLALRVEAAEKRPVVDVEIRVDGRVANRVRAVSEAWRDVRMVLPIESGRNFKRIELRTPPDGDAALRVGKPRLTGCSKNPF
jgi:O-antigen ligase